MKAKSKSKRRVKKPVPGRRKMFGTGEDQVLKELRKNKLKKR